MRPGPARPALAVLGHLDPYDQHPHALAELLSDGGVDTDAPRLDDSRGRVAHRDLVGHGQQGELRVTAFPLMCRGWDALPDATA